MSTMTKIHTEIDELSERRVDLWNSLSEGRDPAVIDEIKSLSSTVGSEAWNSRDLKSRPH